MDLGFNNRTVLITGASGGIGLKTAECFLRQGAKVVLQYHTCPSALKALLDAFPERTLAWKANLANENDVHQLFACATCRFGPVELLVACHGIWPKEDVPLKDMSLSRWKNTLEVNLDGTFLVVKQYLQSLQSAIYAACSVTAPSIVLVSSTAAKFGEAFHADYSVSKAALNGLMLSLKNEIVKLHPKGRVNIVAPGWVRTPMAERAMCEKELLYQAMATTPMKKVSETDDIANAIMFLSSPMAGNITGTVLDVNGGMEGRLLNKPTDFGVHYC
ncbi:NAD(P)-binding protein [Gaertneriomyces semiglobifer]|nr:NAD(P)-binding protein [Gaertneriomyces semiglobifer]